MAGYSATPLAKKLGYKPGQKVHWHDAPPYYGKLLDLPADFALVRLARPDKGVDFVHAFVKENAALRKLLVRYRTQLAPDGAIWISWPKKASKVPTDITEDRVRDAALPLGLVDIKVCAVDDVWSGLKLVIRKELR